MPKHIYDPAPMLTFDLPPETRKDVAAAHLLAELRRIQEQARFYAFYCGREREAEYRAQWMSLWAEAGVLQYKPGRTPARFRKRARALIQRAARIRNLARAEADARLEEILDGLAEGPDFRAYKAKAVRGVLNEREGKK